MIIPRCPRRARLAVLFNTIGIVLFIAGFGLWLYLLLGQASSAETPMLLFLLFGFPLIYIGAVIGLALLLARLARFNIRFLRNYPEFEEQAAEGWHF